MDIQYKSKKLEKALTINKEMVRAYGDIRAKKLRMRLATLRAAQTLSELKPYSPPERCHELTNDRKGQLSIDLDHPYRLLFEPLGEPVPRLPDGGLDWGNITEIRILGVEDTHD